MLYYHSKFFILELSKHIPLLGHSRLIILIVAEAFWVMANAEDASHFYLILPERISTA